MQTAGDGQKSENLADVINGRPPTGMRTRRPTNKSRAPPGDPKDRQSLREPVAFYVGTLK